MTIFIKKDTKKLCAHKIKAYICRNKKKNAEISNDIL